jgi:hypothetical protein
VRLKRNLQKSILGFKGRGETQETIGSDPAYGTFQPSTTIEIGNVL